MSGADQLELLPAVLDSVPFPITSVSPAGVILFVNRAAAENLSGTRETLVGTSLYDYFPDVVQATRERIRQTVDARAVQHFEARVTLPDGREKYFDSAYCPAFDAAGEVIAVQILARDVTEERRAEQARIAADEIWGLVSDDLSMTTSRLRAILENAPMIVGVYDRDMTIRYMNHLVEGRAVEKALGRSALAWLTEETRPAFERAFAEVLVERRVAECEVVGMSGRSWFTRLAPLVHHGEVTQVIGCTLDVTDQRQLREQLARQQKVESLGTMARGIAHDFNNLLTAIMGDTGLLRHRFADRADAAPLLDEIEAASRRAADLCEQMLIYAGRDRPSAEPGDLNVTIAEMARLTRAAVNARIRMAYDLADSLPLTRCNRAQLGQVVLNLINNAADAIGDEAGQITVGTGLVELGEPDGDYLPEPPRPGRYVRLTVRDTGHGVADEARQRIFDPFYSTKAASHGLGLSVVLGILSACGAAIEVDSSPRGTTMTVLFPEVGEGGVGRRGEGEQRDWPAGDGLVLVVDDESAVRCMAARVLTEAGYQVVEAEDGAAAVELLDRHAGGICAVLLDVTMPGMDGHQTLAELRKRAPELPVVLSSGRPIDRDDDDPLVRELQKPYPVEALVRAVAEVCEKR
jgi:PAS domain S-box-containing protein